LMFGSTWTVSQWSALSMFPTAPNSSGSSLSLSPFAKHTF
jgi:hypothetical protein